MDYFLKEWTDSVGETRITFVVANNLFCLYLILKVLAGTIGYMVQRYVPGIESEPHSFQVERTAHWTTRATHTSQEEY